ncbi:MULTISPECIES: hypothetical protein [unclassified Cyanobium]|uniref:hypothetical protein n=1 Tax=unclassified Cyanobium TaxID=2627006 RepID=UPI0020CDA086|nr:MULTISPECIES: hypothetical protein [unclassified Cyanobium]MCP9834238.1 hypothetical protein [Cyanobium sp. La Preciosa 7G6]MCP9937126.1 hypothetical protein [Cyanobium sp. Aljojuca 7A6]
MRFSLPQQNLNSAAVARLLATVSPVLLAVFLAAVLTAALPPKLLDPAWQLGLIAALINNASLALMGVLLLTLALGFDPTHHLLRARWKALRPWILAACLGFVLLIPLQGFVAWRFHTVVTLAQQRETSNSAQKLAQLRQAISTATSHQELQSRVQQLFGNNAGLSPLELRTPMGELRGLLLARAEQASNQLMRQIEAQAGGRPDQLVKESIRISVSAVAYALGFAYLAGVLPRGKAAQRRAR